MELMKMKAGYESETVKHAFAKGTCDCSNFERSEHLNILAWKEKKREDTAKHMTHAICTVYASLHFILLNFKDGAAKLLKKIIFFCM